jgi:drug/metabolite transporter (DMT)-like permease
MLLVHGGLAWGMPSGHRSTGPMPVVVAGRRSATRFHKVDTAAPRTNGCGPTRACRAPRGPLQPPLDSHGRLRWRTPTGSHGLRRGTAYLRGSRGAGTRPLARPSSFPPVHSVNPPSTRGPDRATDIGLVVLTVVWGVNFSVVKGALDFIPAMGFNALRFPLASLTVYAILRARGPLPSLEWKDLGRILLLGIAGNGVYQLLFIHGLDRTTAGNTALLLATVPVWTALFAALIREGTLDRYVVGGIVATLSGMVLVVVGGGAELRLGGSTLAGDAMAAGAAFLWAAYTVGSRGLILRYGSVPVTAWTLWSGSIVLVLLGVPDLVRMDWGAVPLLAGWGAVAYAGILALGLSYVLWYRGVHRLGSARTAAYSNLVPVVALLVAWASLGEVPTVLQWIGAAVILAGIVLARVGSRVPPRIAPGLTPSVPPTRAEAP